MKKLPSCRRFALALLLLSLPALATAQEKKPLRWGTDPTGGAPYIYRDKTGEYTGFEFELAEYLAEKLDRKSVLVEGDWANLPQQLKKPADVENGVDIILNGYELRKDLAAKYGVTRPYYVYRLTLMASKESDTTTWDDLPGKSVGVLGGSAAHRYVKKRYGRTVDLKTNPDVANVMKLVNDRRMDATVQDSPAATYFLSEYGGLKGVGEPVQAGDLPGYYVIYYRKSDVELGKALDGALSAGLRDGTFKKIYSQKKYDLWNADQEALLPTLDKPWPPENLPAEESPWPDLIEELLLSAGMTVFLAVTSFPLAMAIGLTVALGRVYGVRLVSIPLGIYVEVIRGTPLLLQLFFLYYVIPEMLLNTERDWFIWLAKEISPLRAGILGLAINYSAYEAENYRAGLLAIPKGQMEAALALGMSRRTAIRRVVVPQAWRIVIPPVTNDFIALFKDTAACSILFVTELTRKYNELFNFNRDLVIELAFLTAGLYLAMSYPLALLARRLERRLAGGKGGHP
ncbi:ABC transporter permease subunit [Limnoglobus roseus]|uniref:Amino acid ABC transporter permease n=1 Tax=Limnoglobus roseus TaxID=2598579 RepID=A0A5C1A569_9BACT|nr:ABC transporter permease subunit [Limnoglobus roseus]QEL13493.1 amino acid ABC transporter permease [Limnoglobus roseus]